MVWNCEKQNSLHYKAWIARLIDFQWLCSNFLWEADPKQRRAIPFFWKTVGLPDANNWSSITDWLTDLSWLKAEECTFIFENYDGFLKDDLSSKDLFLGILEEDVLPWWESDVEKHVVGGKVKSFQVYIVEN